MPQAQAYTPTRIKAMSSSSPSPARQQQSQQPPHKGGEDEEGGEGGDKPSKLQLDLNLDVAVEIKAWVHGDLTLSLL